MIRPKYFFLSSIFIVFACTFKATAQDTSKAVTNQRMIAVEVEPSNPGFLPYISQNLRYPEVAWIIGLQGKVYVHFVVDKDGSVKDIKPIKCMGAGCESEAVRVIEMAPKWTPGIQNGELVRTSFTVPITFNLSGKKVNTPLDRLRKSDYGFLFFIKGSIYSIDEAQAKLGDSFDPANVETVEEYDNPKYTDPNKKAVYLIIMKDS